MDKLQLEQYSQEDLETMQQVFQIRLGQWERCYQKQLVMEQQKNLGMLSQRHTTSALSPSQTYCSAGTAGIAISPQSRSWTDWTASLSP